MLYIKNMVCNRCIKVVREELEKFGIKIINIDLGEVEIADKIDDQLHDKVKNILEENGFELIEDRKAKIIEKIKSIVIETIHKTSESATIPNNYPDLIEKKIGLEYHYLSSQFSSLESITIEQFIILQKIERVKELVKYGELTLSQIAYQLGYSSVQHLSNQFKKVTGLSATQFKKNTENMRKQLDKVVERKIN